MNVDDPIALDGLGQLEALIATGRQPPIGETMKFSLVEFERGRAVFEGNPDHSVYNPIGSVHGGYVATLLDSTCEIAVHSQLGVGQGYTTLELKIAYHRGLSDKSGASARSAVSCRWAAASPLPARRCMTAMAGSARGRHRRYSSSTGRADPPTASSSPTDFLPAYKTNLLSNDIAGKALITGASSGIGAVYADRLARRGYDLILVARDDARLHALAEKLIHETRRSIEVLRADLTDPADLETVGRRIADDPSIDLLINNAGMSLNGSLLDETRTRTRRISRG